MRKLVSTIALTLAAVAGFAETAAKPVAEQKKVVVVEDIAIVADEAEEAEDAADVAEAEELEEVAENEVLLKKVQK